MRNINSLITALVLAFSSITAVGCATGDEDIDGITEDEAAGFGKLAFSSTDGKWQFQVKSGNGAVLLTSQPYTARLGAISGALSVLNNGVDPAQYRLSQTATGWTVQLYAANHQAIAFTQVYTTKSSATRAVNSSVRAVTTYLDKKEASSSGARVDVLQGASGKYRFNVYDAAGKTVLTSEHYSSQAAAYNGAFSVQAEGQKASAYTLKTATDGRFYFTLTAQNGEIIGVSPMHATQAAAEASIAATKAFLPKVTVL